MTDTTTRPREAAPPHETRRTPHPPHGIVDVREADLEPYIGLRYLSKLFRLMAIILIVLLIAESVLGFMRQGTAAIPTLLAEGSRLIVFAGLLWGAGDLAILLIDVGHDVRATRILIGRQVAHHLDEHHPLAAGATAAGAAPSVPADAP